MADKKTTCCICGTEYEVCRFCPEVANYTPWRRICDTSKHYQIYLILSEYSSGVLSKEDALAQFKSIRINLKDCTTFRPNIYALIQDIFQEQSHDMEDLSIAESDTAEYQEPQENTFEKTKSDEKPSRTKYRKKQKGGKKY